MLQADTRPSAISAGENMPIIAGSLFFFVAHYVVAATLMRDEDINKTAPNMNLSLSPVSGMTYHANRYATGLPHQAAAQVANTDCCKETHCAFASANTHRLKNHRPCVHTEKLTQLSQTSNSRIQRYPRHFACAEAVCQTILKSN